ncbi:MAG: OsmC family protein, partial [Chthoniobacterales bacterium]
HMLWVLHLCSEAKILVENYEDDPVGEMAAIGTEGQFTSVTLRPCVTVRGGADAAALEAIHKRAHDLCFIARSVNFPVSCEPRMEIAP